MSAIPHVREARPGDERAIAAVVASMLATLRQTYRPTPAAIGRKLSRAAALTRLVAVTGDEIVGTVEYERERERLHLMGLGVLEPHRGRGVARSLIAALDMIAARTGAYALSLYTIRQTGNVPLFERLGFAVIAEQPATELESDRHAIVTEVYMQRSVR